MSAKKTGGVSATKSISYVLEKKILFSGNSNNNKRNISASAHNNNNYSNIMQNTEWAPETKYITKHYEKGVLLSGDSYSKNMLASYWNTTTKISLWTMKNDLNPM